MKKDALTPGQDYMTYRGDDPARAYGARRVRLLTDAGVDLSHALNPPGLDVQIDGKQVHVPEAKQPKAGGTHLIFERIGEVSGQPQGELVLLTPAQIKHPWAEGVEVVKAAKDAIEESRAERERRAAEREQRSDSASSRISLLLPQAKSEVSPSPYDATSVVVDAETLMDLIDLAQRAKFGAI